jgi:hypothetical protein
VLVRLVLVLALVQRVTLSLEWARDRNGAPAEAFIKCKLVWNSFELLFLFKSVEFLGGRGGGPDAAADFMW